MNYDSRCIYIAWVLFHVCLFSLLCLSTYWTTKALDELLLAHFETLLVPHVDCHSGSLDQDQNNDIREPRGRVDQAVLGHTVLERLAGVHILHLGIEIFQLLFENLADIRSSLNTALIHNMVHKTLDNRFHGMKRRRHPVDLVVDLFQ